MGGTTSLLFNFLKGRDTVSGHMATIGNRAQTMAAKLKSAGRMTSVIMGALVAVIAGAVSEIVAFTSSIAPMIGGLAAIPALAFGAVVGLTALLVGFRGLGAAMKKYSSGAGQSAEAVAAAEHRLVVAQRSALQAQQDLNDARKTAAERLADVARELAHAHLDERAAILAVKDAQLELRQARGGGDRAAIAHAQLGYEQAVLSLQDVRAKLADVTEEEHKRTAAGVEGSDEVQTALQRQTDAVYELAQAQRALTSGGGGTDKAAEAYARLTAQGKALVDVLHAIAPAWKTVQQATQAALLGNVASDLQRISGVYLPVMRTQLPAIAQGWNNVFRSSAAVASTAGFVNDINISLGRSATMWQRVGNAFGPFLSGFRHWVAVGSAFMPRMGTWVGQQAEAFDRWSASVRETGKAAGWIERAIAVGHEFWVLLKNLGGATAALFAAGSAGPDFLKNLSDGAAALRDFLNTDEGKAKATNLFTQLRDIWSAAWGAFKQLLDALSQADLSGVVGTFTVAGAAFKFLADHMDTVNKLLPVLIPAVVAFKVAILAVRAATAAWAIATAIITAAQWLWNIAMYANPIGLIILAIVAFIAVIVLLWMHSEGFRKAFIDQWTYIWGILKAIGGWFAGPFVDFFKKAWQTLENTFTWGNIVAAFKAGVNALIRAWNALDFGMHLHLPSWAGGYGFDIDDLIPDIPYLDTGGNILETGVAVVHKGETVVPASGGGGPVVIEIHSGGTDLDNLLVQILRKSIRRRGGDVQLVLGG